MQTEFLQKGKFSRSGMLKVVKEVKLYVCVCVCGGEGGEGGGVDGMSAYLREWHGNVSGAGRVHA